MDIKLLLDVIIGFVAAIIVGVGLQAFGHMVTSSWDWFFDTDRYELIHWIFQILWLLLCGLSGARAAID